MSAEEPILSGEVQGFWLPSSDGASDGGWIDATIVQTRTVVADDSEDLSRVNGVLSQSNGDMNGHASAHDRNNDDDDDIDDKVPTRSSKRARRSQNGAQMSSTASTSSTAKASDATTVNRREYLCAYANNALLWSPAALVRPTLMRPIVADDAGCPCERVDAADEKMFGCDRCNGWYHEQCVEQLPEADDDRWFCDACRRAQATAAAFAVAEQLSDAELDSAITEARETIVTARAALETHKPVAQLVAEAVARRFGDAAHQYDSSASVPKHCIPICTDVRRLDWKVC